MQLAGLSCRLQRFERLKSFFAALLLFARAGVAKHNFISLREDPLPFGVHTAQNVFLDTRGMWQESLLKLPAGRTSTCSISVTSLMRQLPFRYMTHKGVLHVCLLQRYHIVLYPSNQAAASSALLVKAPLYMCIHTYILTNKAVFML